jgi:peptidoglycan/xylan/chitin deacetylase (PgdA/CDA1 family)
LIIEIKKFVGIKMEMMYCNKQIFTMDVEKNINNAIKFADLLSKYNLKGEFYICGYLVEKYPENCKSIAKRHIVGGHGFNHENFSKISLQHQEKLIKRTKECFNKINIEMKDWRFPYLYFSNGSLEILTKLDICDSSFRLSWVKFWRDYFFLANWIKNVLLNRVIYLPKPFPKKLVEKPFVAVDIEKKDFYKYLGRIITHCFNYPKFEREIKLYLKEVYG